MFKNISSLRIIIMVFSISSLTVFSVPAYAKKDHLPCTQEDLNLIKKFDPKARNKVKRLSEDTEKIGKAKKESRYAKKIEDIWEFFNSDQFLEMERIYKRCDKKIPRPQIIPIQFWMPDSIRERR